MGDDNEENDIQQAQASGGPAPPGFLFGQFGQPTVPTVTKTSASNQTTSVRPTDGYVESIKQQQDAAEAEKAAVNSQVKVDTDIANAQKDIYNNEIMRQKVLMMARADLAKQHQQRIEEERARREDFIQRATAEPTTYWADRTEGERTMARIGVWLSAFGSAVTGGDNLAIKRINENIDRDIKVKQARAEKMLRLAEMSRGLVSDAYKAKAEELADEDAQRTAGWEMAKKMAESIKIGFIPAERRAEADQKIAQIAEKAAQSRQDAEKNLETRVVHDSGHTVETSPTDGSAKSAPIYDPESGAALAAAPPAVAKELNDKTALATRLIQEMEKMKKIENEKVGGVIPGRILPFGELSKQREQQAKAVALAFKEYKGGGLGRGLPKDTQKFIEEATGAGAEAHLRNESDDMDRAIESVRNDIKTAFKSRGVVQATPSFARKTGAGEAKPAQKKMSKSEMMREAQTVLRSDPNNKEAKELIDLLEKAHGK